MKISYLNWQQFAVLHTCSDFEYDNDNKHSKITAVQRLF